MSLFVDGSLSKTDSVGTFTVRKSFVFISLLVTPILQGASRDVDIGRSGNKTQYIYFKGEMDEVCFEGCNDVKSGECTTFSS